MHMVYPRLNQSFYAVYLGRPGERQAALVDVCATKKLADKLRRKMKDRGERHVIVVPYDKR